MKHFRSKASPNLSIFFLQFPQTFTMGNANTHVNERERRKSREGGGSHAAAAAQAAASAASSSISEQINRRRRNSSCGDAAPGTSVLHAGRVDDVGPVEVTAAVHRGRKGSGGAQMQANR